MVKTYQDYYLTTSVFNTPKEVKGSIALGLQILRLLLLVPGTDSSRPAMGVGLGPKYRFITEDKLDELRTLIDDQLNTYIPEVLRDNASVELKIGKNKFLIINIKAEDTNYIYDTENSDTPIELNSIK